MTSETITQISLDDLHESPFNPRRVFKGLEELAESIKGEGRIHEPLLVRPRIGPLFAGDPDAAAGFEIVFGHRRFRAATLAGLATAPCMVRPMSDSEARSAQTAENLQREDVHPIEEAEGFDSMIRNDGVSADELAELVGKSRSYVYGRLKLLEACPEVRQACLDGDIDSEAALLVARVPSAKLQGKALAGIKSQGLMSHLQDGGKMSYRRVRDYLVEHFTLELKSAIFDPEDATLLPVEGTCSTCPRLSGNAVLFQDVASEKGNSWHSRPMGPNVCTDPDCFARKKEAHLARVAADLTDKGQIVITGNKARQAIGADGKVKGAYLPLKEVQAQLKEASRKSTAPIAVVTIVDQRTGKPVKAVKAADLQAAGVTVEPSKPKSGGYDWMAAQREREVAQAAERDRRAALLNEIRPRMLRAEGATGDLRIILQVMLEMAEWETTDGFFRLHGYTRESFAAALPDVTANELRVLLMDLACAYMGNVNGHHDAGSKAILHDLARLYEVDPEPAPTPAAAGAGQKEAKAAPAKKGVKYHDPATDQTWSGRGLKPAWLKAALADGATLESFEVKDQMVDAGSAGDGVPVPEPMEAA